MQSRKAPHDKHITALDGLRGIAILMVLAIHLILFRVFPEGNRYIDVLRSAMWFGWTGVDLFFTLSGFLITGILLDTWDKPNRVSSFYARRALRIFPLYYFTLLATFIATLVWQSRYMMQQNAPTWKGWLSYLFYFHNWYMPLFERNHNNILGHFWSLGVEEQFYFMWPLCVWFVPRRFLPLVCAAAGVFAFCFRWTLLQHVTYKATPIILMNTFCRIDTLLAGAFCAIAVRDPWLRQKVMKALPWAAGLAIAGIFVINIVLGELWSRSYYTQLYGYSFLAVAYASAVLYAYVNRGTGNITDRFLSLRVLTIFGKYSYGIYVYHIAVFIAGELFFRNNRWFTASLWKASAYSLGLVAVTFLVAYTSFHWLETPFLRLKDRYRARSAPAVELVAAE